MRSLRACAVAVTALMCVGVCAGSKNPADFPLRVKIFNRSEHNFYHHRYLDQTEGEGRADLFSDSDVNGINFSFNCLDKVPTSFGMETYHARWRKPGRVLTVLFPVFGKSGSFFTCDLDTDVKDYVYVRVKGGLTSVSPTEFKVWMAKHDYDPVHGKDVPVTASQAQAPAPVAGSNQ